MKYSSIFKFFENPLGIYVTATYLLVDLIKRLTGMQEISFWNKLIDNYLGEDEFHLKVTYSLLFIHFVYFGLSFMYLFMDITNKPAFLRKYKTQPDANTPIDMKKTFTAFLTVLFNQTFVNGLGVYIIYKCGDYAYSSSVRDFPSLIQIWIDGLGFHVIYEIVFYYSHRLLHHRYFYKIIHKTHHEWTAPIGLMASYCHPIEHFCVNMSPFILSALIIRYSIASSWIIIAVGLTTTINEHSGYHLPFLNSPEFHDYHHLKFTNNFGMNGFLDELHGTDKNFRESVQFKRHKLLLSLKSVNDVYPDVVKKDK